MDIATRFHPRVRTGGSSFLEREDNSMPEDSGNESESRMRRKFLQTTADSSITDNTFRKPALPASATRPPTDGKLSLGHHRRRSTLREGVRVPSGPREFPSPGKRVPSGTAMSSFAPSATSYLPHSTSEPVFSKNRDTSRHSYIERSPLYYVPSPGTPVDHESTNDFDFIPTVNFDDLQNSIANYDSKSPLLSDFPTVGSDRVLPRDTSETNMAKRLGLDSSKTSGPRSHTHEESGLSRSQSLRRNLSVAAGSKQSSTQQSNKDVAAPSQPSSLSLRTRRQSTAPQGPPPSGPAPPPVGAGSRPPRKSLGPGIISSMMESRKASQPVPNAATDSNRKSNLARTGSLTKFRRTTIQPSAAGGAEVSRISALTATTQSRANKVKSLQPPPRPQEPDTPPVRPVSKGNPSRSHTPSSSANKRQSTASGRASGLGARTVSPTDARRLKRLSLMQAPPLPNLLPKGLPLPSAPPADDFAQTKSDMPRLAQPSPSLIPRKASVATPTSARASPEGRLGYGGGGVSLSTKSSHQSLNNSSSASTSRLPAPKTRNLHSSSAQYGEDEEMVPPVPAIPKAYESPRETDLQFFTNAASDITLGDMDTDLSFPSKLQSSGTQSKGWFDRARPHQRVNTFENIERSINGSADSKPARPQLDNTGRKNNNLQPLRLPPLNLMPLGGSAGKSSAYPRPSQELEGREDFSNYDGAHTPEPKRLAKTPSTPMTASKAQFDRRQHDEFAKQKSVRSSTSHFALRDSMQMDGPNTTQFFDDTDTEFNGPGVPISQPRQRNAITPFSSGSLPKGSGEYVRAARSKPSGDFTEDFATGKYQSHQMASSMPQKPMGPRPSRSGTDASYKTAETSSSLEAPAAEPGSSEAKKENSGGLRRKLSLGWRRSNSKAASHSEIKSSPQQDTSGLEKDKPVPNKLRKHQSEMPPPRLPASATWTGDLPTMPSMTARPSFDSTRRKSTNLSNISLATELEPPASAPAPALPTKTKSVHGEHPQPVASGMRASSYGNVSTTTRAGVSKTPTILTNPRQAPTTSSVNANVNVKDKDDLAADDEMRRLSQKRRDVDSAARETEELKKRAVARSPMSPERVLHDRSYALNIFERGEIMDYEKDGIYFTGTKHAKKIVGSLTPSPQPSDMDAKSGNYGYDDERGDYNIVLGDHLAYRYEVVDVLGKGSFGQVVRCVDHKEGGVVAVKIIRNKKRFHQQALVEVGILGRLRDWDPDGSHATLSITSSFYFRSHLCIVTPCLSINLYELIRAHNFVGFSLPLIRRFARQLLACLVFLQNKRIIHCDLKPENILICEARKADVRVIDFGSSCKEEEKVYTYIQSRFYRSPEVILGSSYGLGIDMWSLGCILAELWTGYPLFPGENEQEQLACIMEIFGPPDRHLVDRCTRKKLFFDSVGKPRVTVSSKGRRRRPSSKTLSQALKSDDEAFLDFVTRCLRWDPDRRMKPHDAINHPFITNQSLQQRPGIPDEARRPARIRPTAAVPSTNGSIPSPVKRVPTTSSSIGSSGNAFVQQTQATPAKDRSRPLPETPQTAVRNGGAPTSQTNGNILASPSKQAGARKPNTAPSAPFAAVAGSKRASNGIPVSGAVVPGPSAPQRLGSNNSASNSANLAQIAAREASAARWRG